MRRALRGRHSLRLPHYDYRSPGAYFITVFTVRKRPIFDEATVRGIVEAAWTGISAHFPHVTTDDFTIMPNHVHGILWIVEQPAVGAQHAAPLHSVRPGSLGAIIRSFKAAATKRYNETCSTPGAPIWQRNYFERVIRDEAELGRVRQYIRLNPLKWRFHRENPQRAHNAAYDQEWAWLEGVASKSEGEVPCT